ncbi:hypothetical protein Tco_0641233 [Tanacetum coccineum]
MIKDRQFDGCARADLHKHIAEFVENCGMFQYGNTNADAIKGKLFPSSLADDARVWFNELSLVIMEYLVKVSKRRAFWSLNEDILKITILKTNTPYPSRKIRRIHSCSHQRPQKKLVQYTVSREDQYAVLEIANCPQGANVPNNLQRSDHEDATGHIKKFLEIEVVLLDNGLDVPTRQILDSRGAIPLKTSADAKTAIQEMAEYSQKRAQRNIKSQKTEGLNFYNLCAILVNFADMALPPRELRHPFLRYEGLQYTEADIEDFEMKLTMIYRREVHRVQVFNFGGLSDLMAEGLSARMLMEHRDAQGVSLFTSRAWRRLFNIRGSLVHELILEFFSTFRFGQAILDLDTSGALHFQLGAASWLRLIACSIAGRSQAPEKVTVTDLFYLRGMDVGSINVPYLLARYLRLFAAGRMSGDHIFDGQFVARLAEHFGLLNAEILGGLTVISPKLLIIDMAEVVRLQIYAQFDDTWAWVAMGPERQPDAVAGAFAVAKDAPAADEGDQAVPTPLQAPQQPPPPPPAAAGTHSRDAPDRGLARPTPPQLSRTYSSQTHDPSYLYLLIKPGNKFSTIVYEYVTKPSRIFTLNARMGKRDDCEYGEAKEKPNLKTSLYFEDYYSKDQYAVSIKEDTAYPCLHSPKTTKETCSIRRIQRRPIRRIEDIECEDSGRYQTWSLLQETPNTPYPIPWIRLDCMMVVKEIENGLLEEVEKLEWWFEQDIDDEGEEDEEDEDGGEV